MPFIRNVLYLGVLLIKYDCKENNFGGRYFCALKCMWSYYVSYLQQSKSEVSRK